MCPGSVAEGGNGAVRAAGVRRRLSALRRPWSVSAIGGRGSCAGAEGRPGFGGMGPESSRNWPCICHAYSSKAPKGLVLIFHTLSAITLC